MPSTYVGALAVILGVVSFILFVLALAIEFNWLPESDLDNISATGMAVFGVLAAAGAVGAYKAGV